MSDSSDRGQADPLAPLTKHVSELMELATNEPAKAIPKIQAFERLVLGSGGKDNEGVHLLYFLAYASLAVRDYEAERRNDKETVAFCEKAISEYRLALQLAQYEETETYQERVVVRPGGLFRKPQTQLETRTRRIVKSRIDPKLVAGPLDYVLEILEKCSPGRVQELFGEVKLKYLAKAGRVILPPIFRQAVDNGTIGREDLLAIGELSLKASGPIKSVVVAWLSGGNEPKLSLSLLDHPDITSGAQFQCTGTCTLEKKRGVWQLT